MVLRLVGKCLDTIYNKERAVLVKDNNLLTQGSFSFSFVVLNSSLPSIVPSKGIYFMVLVKTSI